MAYTRRRSRYRPYVPVSARRAQAERLANKARKRGAALSPIRIQGRTIANTFWGRAWCDYIEKFHDYDNRLPRGRRYVRNGSVIDLVITRGKIKSQVIGSRLYKQVVALDPCTSRQRKHLEQACSRELGSIVELMEGRFSQNVMAIMTGAGGLLSSSMSMAMSCSCQDWARLCKHLAAVLYGIGARLDKDPALLFTLRGLVPQELVSCSIRDLNTKILSPDLEAPLSDIFGIEIAAGPAPVPAARVKKARKKRAAIRRQKPKVPSHAKPRTSPARSITRQELLGRGVPPGTISTWLNQGLLVHSKQRAVYRLTATARERLLGY